MRLCLLFVCLSFTSLALAQVRNEMRAAPPKPVALERATNHLDVAYIPDRLIGHLDDRWLRMNVHLPEGNGPFPCVLVVHGGGYVGGDKDYTFHGSSSPHRNHMQHLVNHGYVVVNLNYLLGRGIKPQVFWDYRAAVRFLRANADKYKIDPGRMASWGFSAGGWLSSAAGFSTADDAVSVSLAKQELEERVFPNQKVLVAMDDPRPVHGEFSSRLTAVAADFWQHTHFMSPDDPAAIGYTGLGTEHVIALDAKAGRIDFLSLEIQEEKTKGQNKLHMPDFRFKVKSRNLKEDMVLGDAIFACLDQKLKLDVRTIPPEARPNRRWFIDKTAVTLIPASADAVVFFTTDGSEPGEKSAKYTTPIPIDRTTIIKAISIRKGEKPSAVATFTYTKSSSLPRIVGPEKSILPKAKVGSEYRVQFTTDATAAVVWNLAGHLQLNSDAKPHDGAPRDPCGLRLDPKAGDLLGTPTHAGVYTFQVQVAEAIGERADVQVYVLEVQP